MIQQVRSYKASDGQLFSDKAQATKHELLIEIRGVFQRSASVGTLTTTNAAQIVIGDMDKLSQILSKYKQDMRRLKSGVVVGTKA